MAGRDEEAAADRTSVYRKTGHPGEVRPAWLPEVPPTDRRSGRSSTRYGQLRGRLTEPPRV